MRYPPSEKLEIIRLVEQSRLSVRRTLEHLGVSRATFYRWYDQHQTGGPEALADRPSRPGRVWNRIPDDIRAQIIDLALEEAGEFRSEVQHRGQIWYLSDAQRETVSPCRTIRISRPAREIRSLP